MPFAIARPMPLVEAVTIARRPVKSILIASFLSEGRKAPPSIP